MQTAMMKELTAFVELSTFERMKKELSTNHCSARWVLRWKEVDGQRVVKARLTIRGFQDLATEIATFASTASRWAQRIVCSFAATEKWPLWTLDVGNAFLRSFDFKEQAAITGEPIRQISFSPPKGTEFLINLLPGFEAFDASREVLNLMKPVYGLRDAPKAWRMRLDTALRGLGMRAVPTDAGLYTLHRAQKLILLLTCHVDDLKCTGTAEARVILYNGLFKQFGKLSEKENTFEHCGVLHSRIGNSVIMSQSHYVKQLRLIDVSGLALDKEETLLGPVHLPMFMSLLGAVAWLVLTRVDIPVYVQALQRATHKATIGHCLKLNKIVRWLRRKECNLTFHSLSGRVRTLVVSDAAFRREDPSALAMRGAIVGVSEIGDSSGPGGLFHTLEWYSRRQRRVTRSTFGAETQALADSYEVGRVINLTLAAIWLPSSTVRSLLRSEESGSLPTWVEAVIDCRSILDSLSMDELRQPSESSLIMVMTVLKEAMKSFNLRRLWWVATSDMVSDGLNKGAVPRTALLKLASSGRWDLELPVMVFQENRHVPIVNAEDFIRTPEDNTELQTYLFHWMM